MQKTHRQILEDGRPVIRSPPDVSRITAVALGNDGETVAYGCFGGQVSTPRRQKLPYPFTFSYEV